MAIITKSCWQCEYADCGHVWLRTSEDQQPPQQCGKCRRRHWHAREVVTTQSKTNVREHERNGSTVTAHKRIIACRKKSCPLYGKLGYLTYHWHQADGSIMASDRPTGATDNFDVHGWDNIEQALAEFDVKTSQPEVVHMRRAYYTECGLGEEGRDRLHPE